MKSTCTCIYSLPVRADQGICLSVQRWAWLPSQSPQQHHQSVDRSRPDHCQRHPADLRCFGSVYGEQDGSVEQGLEEKEGLEKKEIVKNTNTWSLLCVFQAVSREFICEECQNSTLNKLESMLEILQTDTKQGTVTPTEIADNILNIMGKEESAASVWVREHQDS